MERNKILLIILSACLFLAAIVSVGLWFFYPREQAVGLSQQTEETHTSGDDPIEWVRRSDFPALSQAPQEQQEDMIIVYGESGEENKTAAAPTPPESVPYTAKPPAPAVSAPVEKPAPPPAPVKPAPPKTAKAPKPAPQKTASVKEYSIQVGAYSTRSRAEEMNQVLKAKGLAGWVFYADGRNVYRLRIGPYTNKAEAEKFLGWVRSIQGFEESQIYERNAVRTAAN
ncbi:MAG: SPOR domain-containing protein [Spirochaetales bacterium]|jgi:cell division septation protein DedD|nr:SPOR domain-containing protein [Spirochaetales bacterium]